MSLHRMRVIIVEDEDLFRELLTMSMQRFEAVEVVGAYRSGPEALGDVEVTRPDVALLDIDLGPGDTGVHVGLKLRKLLPDIGVVLLSNYDEPGVLSAISHGQVSGWAYLLKRSVAHLETILRAIEGTHAHLVVLDPQLVRAFEPAPGGRVAGLTPRQREIIALIAQGYSNAAISEKLVLTVKSVENYISQIYQGLGVETSQSGLHARVKATLVFLEESRR